MELKHISGCDDSRAGRRRGHIRVLSRPRSCVRKCSAGRMRCNGLHVANSSQAPATAREPVEWDTVLAGFQYVWRQKVVLGSISLDMFAVLLGGAVALLPVYAREILHTGPWGLGLLRSAPGVGAGIMAILLAHRPLRRRMGAIMLWCVAGFGVFTIVFGISRSLTLSMIALLLTGATEDRKSVV